MSDSLWNRIPRVSTGMEPRSFLRWRSVAVYAVLALYCAGVLLLLAGLALRVVRTMGGVEKPSTPRNFVAAHGNFSAAHPSFFASHPSTVRLWKEGAPAGLSISPSFSRFSVFFIPSGFSGQRVELRGDGLARLDRGGAR